MGELVGVVERYPLLVALVAAAVAFRWIAGQVAEGSELWAKALGPLGAWWRGRAERRRDARDAREAADMRDVKRQLKYLRGRVDVMSAHIELVDDYLAYDARWHADHELELAARQIEMVPRHLTFAEFRALRN